MSLSVFQVKNQCLKLVTLSTSTFTYYDLLVYIVAIGKPYILEMYGERSSKVSQSSECDVSI